MEESNFEDFLAMMEGNQSDYTPKEVNIEVMQNIELLTIYAESLNIHLVFNDRENSYYNEIFNGVNIDVEELLAFNEIGSPYYKPEFDKIALEEKVMNIILHELGHALQKMDNELPNYRQLDEFKITLIEMDANKRAQKIARELGIKYNKKFMEYPVEIGKIVLKEQVEYANIQMKRLGVL